MEMDKKNKYWNGIKGRSSNQEPSLPPSITEEHIGKIIKKYAPCLRLHRYEAHFPGDPDSFRGKSRFRESARGFDKGWNKIKEKWEANDKHENDYKNIPWDYIVGESLKRYPGTLPIYPPNKNNLRPRDDHNMYGKGDVQGLFLQPSISKSARSSGNDPGSSLEINAPVFVDVSYSASKGLMKILYWFFYELNWWKCIFTHQGDWEHITLLFQGRNITVNSAPDYVYFAQHDSGIIVPFEALSFEEETHPVIFVCRDGHPCCHSVRRPSEYPLQWKTWENDTQLVTEFIWRDYAGAWGEVGEFKFSTGPLGPMFKRHKDRVRIRIKKGRQYLVAFKT